MTGASCATADGGASSRDVPRPPGMTMAAEATSHMPAAANAVTLMGDKEVARMVSFGGSCAGCELSGRKLTGAHFEGANFEGLDCE